MRLASVIRLSRWALGAVLALLLFTVFASLKVPPARSQGRESTPPPDIVFVQAPVVVTGELTKRFPRGSHLVRLSSDARPQKEANLTPNLFAAADPYVSPDASKVLFTAQKAAGARWQVWEMNADGSNQRQITHCAGDCSRPAYLPGSEIVFAVIAGKDSRANSQLFVSRADGSQVRQITFGPGNFQVETVLRDGRILVSAESLLGAPTNEPGNRFLYTIRSDGTGLALFRSDATSNPLGTGADELEDGAILFVTRGAPASPKSGGELAWIGPGAAHRTRITPQQPSFWSAQELDGNKLVVSKRGAGAGGTARFDLYSFDLSSRSLGKLIYSNPKFSSVQAVPLEPHPVPNHYLSILHLQQERGRVICLNAYLTADRPSGRLQGRIAKVRVRALSGGTRRDIILGEAPVEEDGSFYVSVPADQPIRFELLTASGRVMHAQRSWVWTRPGEDMGCAGCHDDKAQAPANHWPEALNRFDTPIVLGETIRAKATGR